MASLGPTVINGELIVNGDKVMGEKEAKGLFFYRGEDLVVHNLTVQGNLLFTSDKRLKENLKQFYDQDVLSKINKTKIHTYNYIYDDKKTPQLGIIAQDIENNFPELKNELITTVDNSSHGGLKDHKKIQEHKLIFILWNAIQVLSQENSEIKERLNELEKKVEL